MSQGLYSKYKVFKSDTGEVVEECFVLRPQKDPAARIALLEYASATYNADLAQDISLWLSNLAVKEANTHE
ncbi:hypothetical protein J2T12_005073 [Paenibacillus anaericanus]|uniref:hypothetical protein n=1 Tax=Paenibacillus anaericanus TaxID=170367 RepID=UPI00278722AF|nr:hypothetical protein [Paenibacillus anaericanus]MDQ0091633.1 hypothetical protein [Paenibacillus anaericanus]